MASAAKIGLVVFALSACRKDGSFVQSERFLTGVHPNDAALGDFDGDGDTDVVVPGLVSPQLATLWNRGGRIDYVLSNPIDRGATCAFAADIDEDGRDELLLAHRSWSSIPVLGAREGQWTVLAELAIDGPEQIDAADLNGDGHLDLAVSRFDLDDVVIAYGDGAGHFEQRTAVPLASGPQPIAIVPGDKLRIVVGEATSDSVALLAPSTDGWSVVERLAAPGWPASLDTIDIDGDGDLEVVGGANLGDAVFVIDGPDEEPSITVTDAGFGAFGVALVRTREGNELAVSNKFADTIMLFATGGQGLRLEDEIATEPGPSPVYALDILGDWQDELVVVDAFADSVSIFERR